MNPTAFAHLRQDVADLKTWQRRLFLYPGQGGSGTPLYIVKVKSGAGAGNTLIASPATYGIEKASDEITEIPAGKTPTDSAADLPDGLGRGTYRASGSTTDVPCFLIIDSLSEYGQAIGEGTVGAAWEVLTLYDESDDTLSYPCLRIGR